jgi:predicted AAA+ superfamily ATPase
MQPAEITRLIQGELWQRLGRITIQPRQATVTPVPGKATVLIGMRRAGKTFCLFSYLNSLKEKGVPLDSILFLNLEDDRLQLETASQLTTIIDEFYRATPSNHTQPTYIMLDEVQVLPGWERVARRLVETQRCELWLTGSSAKMLSKEVATSFRGRSIAHEVWPFDFFEYLEMSNIPWIDPSMGFEGRDRSREQLERYLLQGGFPEIATLPPDSRRGILEDYRNVVVLRDIVERHGITNFIALEALVATAIANSGRLLSVNKLVADFRSRGISVGKDTLFEYLQHLEDAFMVFSVPLYSQSQRLRSTASKKVFCVDPGMVASYSVRPHADLGRLFENLIFLDLKRQGYRVHYYVTEAGAEVDFVAVGSRGGPFIVQACFDLTDSVTREREEISLNAAKKELRCDGAIVTPELYARSRDWIPKL